MLMNISELKNTNLFGYIPNGHLAPVFRVEYYMVGKTVIL